MKTRIMIFVSALLVASFGWMIPTAADGATYYVAKNGSNNRSCTQAQSATSPKLTIGSGLACIKGGDTLIISAGTYAESIEPKAIPSGTASARTVIKTAQGGPVVIKPNTGNSIGDAVTIYDRSYIILDRLTIDGRRFRVGGNGNGPYSHYITFQNGIIRNSENAGYAEFAQSCTATQGPAGSNSHINYINNEIYNCGPVTGHGLYLHARDSLIERNRIHHVARTGIHLYHNKDPKAANNNIIRYNETYSNGTEGILIASGSNNRIHNNIIRGNGVGGIMIYGTYNNQIYNNNIYDNKGRCIWIRDSATNTKVTNNTCSQNTQNKIFNDGASTTLSNNHISASVASIPSAPISLEVAP